VNTKEKETIFTIPQKKQKNKINCKLRAFCNPTHLHLLDMWNWHNVLPNILSPMDLERHKGNAGHGIRCGSVAGRGAAAGRGRTGWQRPWTKFKIAGYSWPEEPAATAIPFKG
jgi:hypothetical protein